MLGWQLRKIESEGDISDLAVLLPIIVLGVSLTLLFGVSRLHIDAL